jgi:hypothetical protein
MIVTQKTFNSAHCRSAGCQPAVSPTVSRQSADFLEHLNHFQARHTLRPADFQSAKQQTASLRYDKYSAPTLW